jgi:tetratricopeptide (TPR) repeat protein
MQKLRPFFLIKLPFIFLLVIQSFSSQADTADLLNADSLFQSKNYQEALVIYESILNEGQAYSPAMLLKMAFISEGIGDYPKTILYLSKYYEHNPSPQIPIKIRELTHQTSLVGYSMSDGQQFLSILTDNGQLITAVLALLLILSLIALVLKGFKTGFAVASLFLVAMVALSNNFLKKPETGIVTGSPSLIMDHPSAGGNLIKQVGSGHRVVIKSSVDIWYKIEWGNQTAYVKKDQVTKI